MEKIDPCKIIDSLLHIREIVQTEMATAKAEIEFRQDEFNDLSHLLEFGKLNAIELCKVGREQAKAKRIRREALNICELLGPLNEYINKHTGFFNGLATIRIDIEKQKKLQGKRRYEIRVREDLREKMEKAQAKS